MIWAIVSKNGDTQIRFDDPAMSESKADLKGKAVWPLLREPVDGERVSFQSGQIEIDTDSKRKAAKEAAESKVMLEQMSREELIEFACAPLLERIEALEAALASVANPKIK